jgi:hypothetical protein
VDRSPASGSILAQAHGRVDMVVVTLKVLLALLAAVSAATGEAGIMAQLCGAGCLALVQLYTSVVYQPLYSRYWNQCMGGMAAMSLWAVACAVMAHMRGQADDQVRCGTCVRHHGALGVAGHCGTWAWLL